MKSEPQPEPTGDAGQDLDGRQVGAHDHPAAAPAAGDPGLLMGGGGSPPPPAPPPPIHPPEIPRNPNGSPWLDEAAKFIWPEKAVPEKFGAPLWAVREFRKNHLVENAGFARTETGYVWSSLAVAAYEVHLAMAAKKAGQASPFSDPVQSRPVKPPPPKHRIYTLTVLKTNYNARVLTCMTNHRDPKKQKKVRVLVRDNRNYVKGMKIQARRSATERDLYVYEGPNPRWRGKW